MPFCSTRTRHFPERKQALVVYSVWFVFALWVGYIFSFEFEDKSLVSLGFVFSLSLMDGNLFILFAGF